MHTVILRARSVKPKTLKDHSLRSQTRGCKRTTYSSGRLSAEHNVGTIGELGQNVCVSLGARAPLVLY